jgi:hypothetical protein
MSDNNGGKDANDLAASFETAEEFRAEVMARAERAADLPPPGFFTPGQLEAECHGLERPAIVEGLFREGEIVTLVAPSKAGKSWLTYHLLYAVTSGGYFLRKDWIVPHPMKTTLFDDELHRETIGSRMPRVARAMGISDTARDRVSVKVMRGDIRPLDKLKPEFQATALNWKPKLIIIDALYRLYPDGMDENSNADMTKVFNILDNYAAETGAAIVVVHHLSKGQQGQKDLMELGSGAGSFGRATDCHIALREHEEDGHYVLEAQPRTFGKALPITMAWEYPLWVPTAKDIKIKGRTEYLPGHPKIDALVVEKLLSSDVGNWMSMTKIAERAANNRDYGRGKWITSLESWYNSAGASRLRHGDAPIEIRVDEVSTIFLRRSGHGRELMLKGGDPS